MFSFGLCFIVFVAPFHNSQDLANDQVQPRVYRTNQSSMADSPNDFYNCHSMRKLLKLQQKIKSQAIVDFLAQFPGEDTSPTSHEVPREVGEALLADMANSTWTLRFDGSSTSTSSGPNIALIKEDG